MPTKSYREAINEAIDHEMARDENVIVIGEDVSGGAGCEGPDAEDAYGGVLGVTKGLVGKYGRRRVIDTPITESAIMGTAAGAALTGLRPVAEMMFVDFLGVCFDMIYNQAAKFRYMFGGTARTPLVVRAMIGGGFRVPKDVPPYVMATGHPLSYSGLNVVGLRRRGFTSDQIGTLKQLYHLLFRSKYNVSQAVAEMEQSFSNDRFAQEIMSFVKASKRGLMPGRARQSEETTDL